jgi:hypothetical protein
VDPPVVHTCAASAVTSTTSAILQHGKRGGGVNTFDRFFCNVP